MLSQVRILLRGLFFANIALCCRDLSGLISAMTNSSASPYSAQTSKDRSKFVAGLLCLGFFVLGSCTAHVGKHDPEDKPAETVTETSTVETTLTETETVTKEPEPVPPPAEEPDREEIENPVQEQREFADPVEEPIVEEAPEEPIAPAPDPEPVSAYFSNCAEARSAGASPLYAGILGYRPGLDRDGDGVACE